MTLTCLPNIAVFLKTFKDLPSEVVNFECFNSSGLDKKNEQGKCMCFKRRLGTDMRRDIFSMEQFVA